MRYAMFILYVRNQNASRDFYASVLGLEPVLDVPGMTEFQLNDSAFLGLMPEAGIARIICSPPVGEAPSGSALPNPSSGMGIPRCELYLPVDDPAMYLRRVEEAGGRIVSPASARNWGDLAGYGVDPDGHVLAFASKLGPRDDETTGL